MRIPTLCGIIDRRILINYHVDPKVIEGIVPGPFRPKVVNGAAIAGVCLIRLRDLRPALLPPILGVKSENAAHRIAVEWDSESGIREGVYIPRRDTNSRLNTLVGGRLFPGIHHHARFNVSETDERLEVALESDDGATHVSVAGTLARDLPTGSVFGSLTEASAFFKAGSIGYSATESSARFDGLELRCRNWRVEPLAVESVRSSFFENLKNFPKGSIEFDCALLMRNIDHEWHGCGDICCP